MPTLITPALENFSTRVIEALALAELPEDEREDLALALDQMLLQRIVNVLTSYLENDELIAITEKAEATGGLAEFLSEVIARIPDAGEIIAEEIELFFQELTSNVSK